MTVLSVAQSLVQALLAALGPSQNERLLRLHTPLGPNVLLAERMLGLETIGPRAPGVAPVAGFKFDVLALSTNAHLRLKDLMGQAVRLDLLTQQSRTDLRPFHGHVTSFALLGSDGGLARYRLTIEPWLSFLAYRQDAWVFQDKTVMEILDEVFADYQAQGKLMPAWRWEIADPAVYPRRSLCIQYHESDLDFVQRLMAEEGLFCWFEHQADDGDTLGQHTLVIADHNACFQPNVQAQVRFTQSAAAGFKADSLTRFQESRRVGPASMAASSWNYRAVEQSSGQAPGDERIAVASLPLALHDQPGAYAYETPEQAQRMARRQLEAVQAPAWRYQGEGTLRQAACATTFSLSEHPSVDGAARWVMLTVQHRARNNITADLSTGLQALLGKLPRVFAEPAQEDAPDAKRAPRPSLFKGPANHTPEPLYQLRLIAQDATIPVRAAPCLDDRGDIVFRRPRVSGTQTAVVVGLGEPVHTDRDGRIKIQFHWQRGGQSALRLDHAAGGNAPGDDSSGTWVRVAQSWAGDNWGAHFTPRLGQEVLVSFIEDDIDRPVVIGSVYNGKGRTDAQGNDIGAGAGTATGNAAAWFPGNRRARELQGHQHPHVLAGFKSQSLEASQGGGGGYNQLVFDDTPGEARVHLSSASAASGLQIGHLLQQGDNQRLAKRGHGLDLTTDAYGAVRAGAGLHLTAYAREQGTGATACTMEARAGMDQLEQAQELVRALAETAQKHNAKLGGEAGADTLPGFRAFVLSQESLSTTDRIDANLVGAGRAESSMDPTVAPKPNTYDEQLQFVNALGTPLGKIKYGLKLSDGSAVTGETDSQGRTQRVVTGQPVAIVEASLYPSVLNGCCAVHAKESGDDAQPLTSQVDGIATNATDLGVSQKQVGTPKGEARGLTSGEIAMARQIFKDSIDYSKVRVHNGEYLWFGLQPDDTAMTPNGEMFFNSKWFAADFSLLDAGQQHWFMHEMVHVWQYQLGYPVKTRGTIRLGLSYQYELDESRVLSTFNMEAQGDLLADYFALKVLQRPDVMRQRRYADSLTIFEEVTLKRFLSAPGSRSNLPGGE